MAARPAERKILRLVDANLNRCREGLRVLEDTARFVWEDARLFEAFRGARHELDRLSRAQYPKLVAARGSETDQGRRIRERARGSFEALIRANCRRCEEALRVLEEYGKLFSEASARRVKALRFRMYDLEKRVLAKFGE